MRGVIEALCRGASLEPGQVEDFFRRLLEGELDGAVLAGVLVGLAAKGESPVEIAAAARAVRAAAAPFPRPDGLFGDCCGTGGDGAGTFNISTAAAFVTAASGLPVVKHGNRSVSSRSGSADVLTAAGAEVRLSAASARRCLDETGFAFLLAPAYHGGLRHAMPVRKALGIRTIFNIIGPLANPAAPPVQLVGVYAPELVGPVAETLHRLGCQALVVHGSGLDEVATHGSTTCARATPGGVTRFDLEPGDFGVASGELKELVGGEPQENAELFVRVLSNDGAPALRDAIAVNAGALLWIAGLAADPAAGASMAGAALEDGRARDVFGRFVRLSRELGASEAEASKGREGT